MKCGTQISMNEFVPHTDCTSHCNDPQRSDIGTFDYLDIGTFDYLTIPYLLQR
jgi:hypothetical protein